MNDFWDVVRSLAPTVLVGLIFWLIMYVILRADKHERRAYAQIEAEERAKFAAEHGPDTAAEIERSPQSR